ncbi:thioredoxin family protein, partial [Candidatus Saccharibacteria bacterium]|nr:thioredoxin family protein [Candidatus Saccharibacteria bacterium]
SINIDEEGELAEKYGVSSIPCFVVKKDGEEVAREVGAMPIRKLERLLFSGGKE